MIFPQAMDGGIPRHPSQLYEALGKAYCSFSFCGSFQKSRVLQGLFQDSFVWVMGLHALSWSGSASLMRSWGFRPLICREVNG